MIQNRSVRLHGPCAAAMGLAIWAAAPVARADCKAAAKEHVRSLAANVTVAEAKLITREHPEGESIADKTACVEGKRCLVVWLTTGEPTLPEPNAEGLKVVQRWKRVPQSPAARDCQNLIDFHLERTAALGGTAPALTSSNDTFSSSQERLLEATSPEAALAALEEGRVGYAPPSALGAGHSFNDVAAETIQILGQLVVDRASAKGYSLLQARLEEALECATKTKNFSKTCALLDSLRIQDIAMAPEALAKALAADLLKLAGAHTSVTPQATSEQKLRDALFRLALSLVSKSSIARDLALRTAISELVSYATTVLPVGSRFEDLPLARQAAALGVLAFARCVATNVDKTSTGLAGCNVEAELDTLKPKIEVKPAALKLAQQLVALGGALGTTTGTARLALETVAGTACMVLSNAPDPKLECPSIESASALDDSTKVAFAAAFVDAVLDRDAATFVVVAAKLVDLKWHRAADEETRTEKRSALRLMTGLLTYAASYAEKTEDASGDDKHVERTKILESLTKDMTDRNGRGGDCILSIAGALRAEGGLRVATRAEASTFYGPIGLPLGIAFDVVPEASDAWGFHMQLDAVNLGNYLALDNGPKVKEPNLGDAFAPGLTVGAAYGQDLPVVVGAFFSYTPQFELDPETDKHGSLNFGATVGIHVPLIDMN